jgi:putative flippase GtrA
VGNVLTRRIFAIVSGKTLTDTQSGLRGVPAWLVPAITVLEGERYEYEMNVLTYVATATQVAEVPIEAVYLNGNRSSHFRPIADSLRIYFVLLRFFGSSLIAAGTDYLVFVMVFAATSNLPASITAGRVSSVANFALNRRFIFKRSARMARTLLKYYGLVGAPGFVAYFFIRDLTGILRLNVLVAKIIVEMGLWFASISVQRKFVFACKESSRP